MSWLKGLITSDSYYDTRLRSWVDIFILTGYGEHMTAQGFVVQMVDDGSTAGHVVIKNGVAF